MTDPASLRVGLDGYNLALVSGTGVATYGRTVAAALALLGRPIDLVYGVNIPQQLREELRAPLFHGQLGNSEAPRLTWRRRLRQATMLPLPRDLIPIPHGDRVIAGDGDNVPPAASRLFNRREIFRDCARHFRRFGRFMTLRMPDPPAVMHWTYPLPIRLAGARNVYTLHDLVPLRLPQASLEDKRYYDALVRACVRDAAHVVTVSERSRQDIVELLDADPARVTNCYQASVQPTPREPAALGQRLDRLFGLSQDGYFLFVGAIEPKKNLGRLIQGYLESGVSTPFVIVGGDGWRCEAELRLLCDRTGVRPAGAERIRRLGHLPRALVADLIGGARATLFPALYEGFGLPALEALQAGSPLLASTTGALPEVVGDAALQVDPYEVSALAAAIRRLDGDDALRHRLSAAGPVQAARFSLRRFATCLDEVYRKVQTI